MHVPLSVTASVLVECNPAARNDPLTVARGSSVDGFGPDGVDEACRLPQEGPSDRASECVPASSYPQLSGRDDPAMWWCRLVQARDVLDENTEISTSDALGPLERTSIRRRSRAEGTDECFALRDRATESTQTGDVVDSEITGLE